MDKKLSIKNINKIYKTKTGNITAIEDISLDIYEGEIIGIVGTSGCGKSTLLNIIAGLDRETKGKIIWNKKNPRISYMLQNDALLPWRNVIDNATLGLELLKIKEDNSIEKVKNMLEEYGLSDFLNKKPRELSGGMKQRVALIRSLAINPDILLLDEPFSALDYYTRLTISSDVYDMLKKTKTTTIIITHDVAEALSLSDKVVVLSSRPSTVKKIYDVDIPKNLPIMKKRTTQEFNELYESIWRDLDV